MSLQVEFFIFKDPFIALWMLNLDVEYRYDPMDLLEKHCLNEFDLLKEIFDCN